MQQRIERLFCLMKRRYLIDILFSIYLKKLFSFEIFSFKTLPDYISLKEPWNTDNFKKFHLGMCE